MINITSPEDCCGCTGCISICPKDCINTYVDKEGFKYPKVDLSLCVDCSLCEKGCPVIQNKDLKQGSPMAVYAAVNTDEEIRLKSSSGGVFTAIAESVLEQGGIVFGAKFDKNWDVIHSYTETKEDLAHFRGSKYVQSDMVNCYKQVKEFLKTNRVVLFSGSPCQISGLRLFLRKEYTNLLCIDFICHGVPSPKAWRAYKREILTKASEIESFSFRNKDSGWKNYSVNLNRKNKSKTIEPFRSNIYMKGFLADLFLRPSCHSCPSKGGRSGADITIADYWGIDKIMPDIDDDKGCSLIIIHSGVGEAILSCLNVQKYESNIEDATRYNISYYRSVAPHKNRLKFFKLINSKKGFSKSVSICLSPSLREKLVWKLNRLIRK